MHHVFKVPGTSVPFLQNLILAGTIRSKLVAMAAGRVIGQYAPLGPANTLAPEMYFRDVVQTEMDDFLNGVLSVAPADIDAIRKYAEKWYLLRHRIAHGCCNLSATGINGVYNAMHVGEFFSPEELGMMKFDGQRLAAYTAGFEPIYKAVAKLMATRGRPDQLLS